MRKRAVLQIRIFTGIVLFISLILIGRLYQLQVLNGDVYLAKGEKQYVHTVQDIYNRGTIYFTTRDGELIAGASMQSGYVLSVDPGKVKDAEATFNALSPFLTLDHNDFIHKATLAGRTYVEVDNKVTDEAAEKIEALKLSGVQLYKNRWRYYPGDTLEARTVGFVGFSGNDDDRLTGRYGLERYYEDVLRRDGEQLSVNFFAEIFSNLGDLVFENKKNQEGSIVTTIEPTVARMLQDQLKATNDKWSSKITGGVIINPKTGEIYAIDAVPTYNPNDRTDVPFENFKNPLVENVYELGSIIKALTMASGLDSGAVSPSTTYFDPGCIKIDGYKICNYDGRGRGTVPMQEVLNQSLNTGVSFVVSTMGRNKFRDYFTKLKLGSETGIDLPGEAYGLVSNLESPREVEYATASFGQGIAVTPIAAVRALSALGNGGTLINPHITKKIIYEDGTEKEVVYPEGDRVWSEATSETISRMLTKVVDEALANGKVSLPHYSIAAKTGTAQIADRVNGGYYKDRYLHSFFGYFPSYDPQFLVFLYTDEPQGVEYASHTLTEPFMNIVKFLINYYNVPPDR